MNKSRPTRNVNPNMAATHTVRLMEAFVPAAPENIILNPKEQKKKFPGFALLTKLAEQKDRKKEKLALKRALTKADEPAIDMTVVDEVVEAIWNALNIFAMI